MEKKNLLILVLGLLGLVFAAGFIYTQFSGDLFLSSASSDQVSQKVLKYVNEKILAGFAKADLDGAVESSGCLYKLNLKINDKKFVSYATKDGKLFFPQGFDLNEKEAAATSSAGNKDGESNGKKKAETNGKSTVGDFSQSNDEVCLENNKPILYFFGAEWCPHCKWEHPLFKEVVAKFSGLVSFHDNMGTKKEQDIFSKYSSGGIPTIVLGCKYFRVGSGEAIGKEKEKEALTSLICDLTQGKPAEVCGK